MDTAAGVEQKNGHGKKKTKLDSSDSVQPKLVARQWLDARKNECSNLQQSSGVCSNVFKLLQFNTLADGMALKFVPAHY